ncbi:DUF4450 domain-containing protein [Termitidicoccus mucosus]|uniref:DUF4450 domain-containing protein n=1 Tax=Termitidicoccus mucosus TaxID=1184151 RepID=A0A178IHP0_9BACT|nr:hypothetical protein AW736_15945 [Opitutaceae bacterium TSB47]
MKPTSALFPRLALLAIPLALSAASVPAPAAQMFQPRGLQPNLVHNIERPLRYAPDGHDFVIENGGEFFNRPLYGGHTAFRVDAGDMPEFSLYLPGRGGNLRLGIRAADGSAKWLHEAARVTARYRPGEMLYEIRDPLLGADAVLRLHAIALHQTDGLIVRVEAKNLAPASVGGLELIAAYGGLNGRRGKRDGDIGTEAVPIGEYFQLKPEACAGNAFALEGPRFTLRARPATIAGLFPAAARLALADAAYWSSPAALLASAAGGASVPQSPVVTAVMPLAGAGGVGPLFLCLQRIQETDTGGASAAAVSTELADYAAVTSAGRPGAKPVPVPIPLAPACAAADLPRVFGEAAAHFAAVRSQIAVETPDPFINAAVAALNIGADAVWDEPQGAVMHGAIAWRSKLLGWRGPYAMDALGWHDRARRHLAYWATRQNTDPVPAKLPPPDENANLARSEAALHSNGDMANSHYDMNTVYIDALFRHFLWTGDFDFARELWPVIERHLAWQRRLFRREFGPERLPLYEAYAQIWASDDLQYHGGGVTYASAYAWYHNTQAARLARLLGLDATPYEREAALIARAMREFLWMPGVGMFGEFRDLLGLGRLHESPGLWSFYHTMDAGLVTREEAYSMARYVNARYPAIPVRGPGVPDDGDYRVRSSTDWMPYTWSVNNVVMGENIHAALGLWQAGVPERAFTLMKSSLLASMFMGICPGNVGSLNYLDVYRRESQRDFADGSGVTSRAVVEGLFGVQPDALAGELVIAPGFPGKWTRASIKHPDVSYTFERDGKVQRFVIEQHGPLPAPVTLRVPVLSGTATVTCTTTGETRTLHARNLPGQYLAIERLIPAKKLEVEITWSGDGIIYSDADEFPAGSHFEAALQRLLNPPIDWSVPPAEGATFSPVNLDAHFNDRVTQIFKNEYRSPRSPHVSLAIPKQGIGAWAGHVNATADIDDSGLRAAARTGGGRVTLPNGVFFATPGEPEAPNILFTSLWDNYPGEAAVRLEGRARHAYFLMAGSTNWMQSRIDNGEVIVTYADGTNTRLALRNPDTWWPIEQDLFYDDYQFRCDTPPPARLNLKTGEFRALDADEFKGNGRTIPGGAATVLHLPLDPKKELRSLTLRTLSNEVVIGLMAVTLER